MKTAGKGRNTASERSTWHPSEEDIAIVLDALRIARDTLSETADKAERAYPTSPLVERLRIGAEQMEDLRSKLDS